LRGQPLEQEECDRYGCNNSLLDGSIYNVYRRLERWTTTCSNHKPSTLCSHFQFRLNIAYSIAMLSVLAARTSYGWGFMQTKRSMKFSYIDNLHESHICRTLRNIYRSKLMELKLTANNPVKLNTTGCTWFNVHFNISSWAARCTVQLNPCHSCSTSTTADDKRSQADRRWQL